MAERQVHNQLNKTDNIQQRLISMIELAKSESLTDLHQAIITLQRAKSIGLKTTYHNALSKIFTNIGLYNVQLREFEKSQTAFEQALTYVAQDSIEAFEIQAKLIKSLIIKGDFNQGKTQALKLLNKIKEQPYYEVKLYLLVVLAISNFRLNDYKASKKAARAAITLQTRIDIHQAANQIELAKAHEILGRIAVTKGDYKTAEIYYEKAIPLARADESNHLSFGILNNYTHIYFEQGDVVKAFEKISLAEEAIPKNNTLYYEAFIAGNKADIYGLAGDINNALEFNYRSLELMQQYSQPYYIVSRLTSIGQLLLKSNQKEKALKYLNEAKTLGDSIQYKEFHNEINRSIGKYYLKNGDYDQALQYFQNILEQSKIINNTGLYIRTLISLGETYLAQEEYQIALQHWQEALDRTDKIGSTQYKGQILNGIGRTHLENEALEDSKKYLEQALLVNQEGNYKDLLEVTYQLLYQWYKAKGNFEQALSHYQKFKSYEIEKLHQANKEQVQQLELNINLQKKEKEIQLLKQKEILLQQANENLNHFASVASHDMREPLRMIHQFTQLLKRRNQKVLDERSLEYVDYILDGSSRMTTLIKNLLEFAKAGKLDKPLIAVNLNDVLQLAKVNLHLQIKEKQAQLEIEDNLPIIQAHRNPIVEVFQNIISNGIKFQKADTKPQIKIYLKSDTPTHYTIAIQDNGIGIQPKNLEKVFEIFNRFEARSDYEGNGIGLATCKRIMESYNGSITLESTVGEGTTFYLHFAKT